jgi:hypothetical protein
MAQLALNNFKTVTLEVTDSEQTAYTAPTGYTSIVLYAHITNIGSTTETVTVSHKRSTTSTEIAKALNNGQLSTIRSLSSVNVGKSLTKLGFDKKMVGGKSRWNLVRATNNHLYRKLDFYLPEGVANRPLFNRTVGKVGMQESGTITKTSIKFSQMYLTISYVNSVCIGSDNTLVTSCSDTRKRSLPSQNCENAFCLCNSIG